MTPEEWSAVRLSLLVSTWATLISLPLGIPLGWLLARKRFPGKLLLETAVNLPLVLPPVVTGYFLLILLGKSGLIGKWLHTWCGISLVFNWKGAAVAAAVMAMPLLVRSVRQAFASTDRKLEQAARTLGAGPWELFFTVTLPLAKTGLIAGCVLVFARSLGEFGATLMLAGNIAGQTRTIPLYLYQELESPRGFEHVPRLVFLSLAISAAALLVGEWLERHGAPQHEE